MDLSSEFWAAIAGAAVGGLFSAIILFVTLKAGNVEARRREHLVTQGLARSLLLKLVKVQSDFVIFKRHSDESRSKAEENGAEFGWSWFVALANLPRAVTFTSEEMGILLGSKDNDLFNDVAALDEVHHGFIESLALYRGKRASLSDLLPSRKMNGPIGSIELDEAEFAKIAPRYSELDQMALDLTSSFDRYDDVGLRLSGRVSETFNRCYNLGISLTAKKITDSIAGYGGTSATAHD